MKIPDVKMKDQIQHVKMQDVKSKDLINAGHKHARFVKIGVDQA